MSLIYLKNYKNKNQLFTTPSHSQKKCLFAKFKQFYKFDISETDTHEPEKHLYNSEKYASKIYKTKQTKFLTNGSTSGIITGVLALINKGDKVLVWSNAHPSHHNAIKLAGGEPIYYDLPCNEFGVHIPEFDIEKYFKENDIKLVIITSPTYEGYTANLKEINKVCTQYNVKLLVDEAHGALYPFSDKLPETAIPYADITVQSLHKTAGGLNPTALLHCNCDADINSALAMINTTSPSYPLLMSIEKNIRYLDSNKGKKEIDKIIKLANSVREIEGFEFGGDDVTKILIKKQNMTGFELSEELYKYGIEDEKTNETSTMLLTGIGTNESKINRLIKVLNLIR